MVKLYPYTRKKVDQDGYIIEEVWVAREGGLESIPLDKLFPPYVDLDTKARLRRGESVEVPGLTGYLFDQIAKEYKKKE